MAAQTPTVAYKLGMSKPWTHTFEVEVTYTNLPADREHLDLILPVWRSGRYLIFDFAGNMLQFNALDGSGNPLTWTKVDKTTWRVEKKESATVIARYTVFGNDFTASKIGLNDEHAFVNGAAVFLYAEQYRRLPVMLKIIPYGNWHVTTGLDAAADDSLTFTAPSYDYLLDCPLEIGNQRDFTFDVDGTPHVLSMFGEGNYDSPSLMEEMSKLVKTHKDFWGEFPYKRYVFLVHIGSQFGGGTEYLNSTILGSKPFVFKGSGGNRGFLGLVSHEFFHTWNVKQLRPRGIHPYDYTKENYTKELWIAEGTTSYYGPLLTLRAGFNTAKTYIENIANAVMEDRQRPGNDVQSLSESSFDAWIKYWRPSDHSYNSQTDYYGKGAHVSLLLDLEIRHRSNNKHSLDDVMRAMYKRFPLTGSGYTVDDFQHVAEEFAGSSLNEFFNDYVHGTKALDWERMLGYAGLELVPRNNERRAWLGAGTADSYDRTRVTRVIIGSPAYDAGLNVGDEVLALNGHRVRTADLQARIAELKAGEKVKLSIFRNDRLRELEVTLRLQTVPPYKISKVEKPTELQKSIYESWVNAGWE